MNRLIDEVSPYLVQHATNPVDWWPWCPGAFAESRATGKPILLSIGYSACHWCHVMAHESFEDDETAALMNALFVNIKVDREERPDVDHVYMSALQALGQQGGWPLTMFLAPDGKPFWGGTYFPKTARYGQPAFKSVLTSVAAAFRERPGDIAQNTQALTSALAAVPEPAGLPDLTWLNRIAARISALHDPENGGLSGAPKFPHPPALELLWRAADRTGDESMRATVLLTLERMSRGGIYDHVGGGFSRYSVDEQWLVPHFEKMLYDNAQLVGLLALASAKVDAPLLAAALDGTIAWLEREMLTSDGAFAASQDADSLGPDGHIHEGAFYVWTPQEVAEVLRDDAAASFCAAYDITAHGNFEGRSIPNRLAGRGLDEQPSASAPSLHALRLAREDRPPPARDDKVLTDWNALAIAALARSALLTGRPEHLELARKVYTAVLTLNTDGESLAHASRMKRNVRGLASDYAALALAALALAEAGDPACVADAERWCAILEDRFVTESGSLAMSEVGEDLPVRPAPTHDDAVPNANGLAAEAYIRLYAQTLKMRWLDAADRILAACAGGMTTNPFGHASLFNALELRLRRADVTINAGAHSIAEAVRAVPYPNRTIRISADSPEAALVCSAAGVCSMPLTTWPQVRSRIDELIGPGTPR